MECAKSVIDVYEKGDLVTLEISLILLIFTSEEDCLLLTFGIISSDLMVGSSQVICEVPMPIAGIEIQSGIEVEVVGAFFPLQSQL